MLDDGDRLQVVAESLSTMNDDQVERFKDWITDKYALVLEGKVKGRTRKLLENLAKRVKIAV